jgi:hypothetical protein
MRRNILVAGVGQLGSRYVQGMARYPEPLDIWVLDTSPSSLDRLKLRWSEVADREVVHKIYAAHSLQELPQSFDLVVLSTSADVRPELTQALALHAEVGNWIFEKVLAQSVGELTYLAAAVAQAPAWVNTPRHLWSLYRHLRPEFGNGAVEVCVEGLSGVACNAIHFIDLVNRWNQSNVTHIDTSGLSEGWSPAKREGFFEVEGRLRVAFEDGSVLTIDSRDQGNGSRLRISDDRHKWEVMEASGYAMNELGRRVEGAVEYQSSLTTPLMVEILHMGHCNLPTLEQSIRQHNPLLLALQTHWSQSGRSGLTLPIT